VIAKVYHRVIQSATVRGMLHVYCELYRSHTEITSMELKNVL